MASICQRSNLAPLKEPQDPEPNLGIRVVPAPGQKDALLSFQAFELLSCSLDMIRRKAGCVPYKMMQLAETGMIQRARKALEG